MPRPSRSTITTCLSRMSCSSFSTYSESSGGSLTGSPASSAAARALWSIPFLPPFARCRACASGTTTCTRCSPRIIEQYTWHSSKEEAARAPSPFPRRSMYTGYPCLVYPWNGDAGMMARFSRSRSHRGFFCNTSSTPLVSPTFTVVRQAIASRIIFSASSILYFRATKNRRAVAGRLPHGHISAGISSPFLPKRATSASTVCRQSGGCGYSWKTAPFEGTATAGSFSSPPNHVPNMVVGWSVRGVT
mmetsp:Transcript_4698/g.17378  ORF Transcript_4698/g.17378 Transcript_4698/m.17378 type:complete len:247 (-) Transcript_4698:317-1057(-)